MAALRRGGERMKRSKQINELTPESQLHDNKRTFRNKSAHNTHTCQWITWRLNTSRAISSMSQNEWNEWMHAFNVLVAVCHTLLRNSPARALFLCFQWISFLLPCSACAILDFSAVSHSPPSIYLCAIEPSNSISGRKMSILTLPCFYCWFHWNKCMCVCIVEMTSTVLFLCSGKSSLTPYRHLRCHFFSFLSIRFLLTLLLLSRRSHSHYLSWRESFWRYRTSKHALTTTSNQYFRTEQQPHKYPRYEWENHINNRPTERDREKQNNEGKRRECDFFQCNHDNNKREKKRWRNGEKNATEFSKEKPKCVIPFVCPHKAPARP